MAFCGVIPILYPVTLISFFLLYLADKFLIFKYYQTPIQYSHFLHKVFRKTLFVSVWFHFGVTAYFLGEPSLIASGAYLGTAISSVSSNNGRIDNMFRTAYILPYAIMFILMFIYAIFREGIGSIIKACLEKCKDKSENVGYKSEMVQQSKLFSILTEKQRNTLKLSL